jgi:hypothetical protein
MRTRFVGCACVCRSSFVYRIDSYNVASGWFFTLHNFLASQRRQQDLETTVLHFRIATRFYAAHCHTQRQNYMTPLLRRPIQHLTSRLTPQVALFCNQRHEISFPLARDGLGWSSASMKIIMCFMILMGRTEGGTSLQKHRYNFYPSPSRLAQAVSRPFSFVHWRQVHREYQVNGVK